MASEPTRRWLGRHGVGRRWFGRHWFGQGRTRALLSLGVVASAAVVGTTAYWVDSATVTTGPVSSGTMDLQVGTGLLGSVTWGAVGTGTGLDAATVTATGLTPGETQAFDLGVRNVGAADFTLAATVAKGSSWTYVDQPLVVRLYSGGTATTDTSWPIQETCGGTAQTAAAVTVPASGSAPLITTPPRLVSGASQQLCVTVGMSGAAANDNQGKTGTLRLDFTATQVQP